MWVDVYREHRVDVLPPDVCLLSQKRKSNECHMVCFFTNNIINITCLGHNLAHSAVRAFSCTSELQEQTATVLI